MKRSKGFTLLELLLAVAIVGILAAVAYPKFAGMLRKSKEGQAKATLGNLRSAISLHYSCEEANFPSELSALVPLYIDVIAPVALGANHPDTVADRTIYANGIAPGEITDASGWIYTSMSGDLAINCLHADTAGAPIYTW